MAVLNKNRKKAYSLLEIAVSLAIMALIITTLFSFLITTMKVSTTSLARSFVREELANITLLISRDFRNADYITTCQATSCDFVVDGQAIRWYICTVGGVNYICNDRSGTRSYTSSVSLKVEYLDFTKGYSDSSNLSKLNIILTISVSHINTNLNIVNVVRQTSISTRNYELK